MWTSLATSPGDFLTVTPELRAELGLGGTAERALPAKRKTGDEDRIRRLFNRVTAGTFVARPFEPKANPDADLERRERRLSAAYHGFDVHCAVRIAADDDAGRERLVRYCTRPPFALDRIERLREPVIITGLMARSTRQLRVDLHSPERMETGEVNQN